MLMGSSNSYFHPRKRLRASVENGIDALRIKSVRAAVKLQKSRLSQNESRDIIWIIGDGRSGSTWLQNLFIQTNDYLGLFEPFHSFNPAAKNFQLNCYQRPGTQNDELERLALDVFGLRVLNNRVVYINSVQSYQGLVVKDVFASLLAKWALERLPHKVRPVILIRNPIDVALSKCKHDDWLWESNPMTYLEMPGLQTDHLAPLSDEIRSTSEKNNPFLNHLLVWCILNRVLLNQFGEPDDMIIRYEDLQTIPVESTHDMMTRLGIDFDEDSPQLRQAINRVSRVSDAAGVEHAKLPKTQRWMKSLKTADIDEAMRIVEKFDLLEWCAD